MRSGPHSGRGGKWFAVAFLRTVAVVALLTCLSAGCKKGLSKTKVTDSESSFDAGVAAMEQKNYQEAAKQFTQALDTGGLNADLRSDALLKRAKAYIELKEFDKATADLNEVEPHAPDVALVHQLRGDLYLGQSKKAEARKEYDQARKFNPKIAIPTELK
jgi:predicted negative regulator of RcsB-dependent stress response